MGKYIILKSDDFFIPITKTWNKFLDYTIENNMKPAIGMIGCKSRKCSDIDKLKELHNNGDIEIFNHGQSHSMNEFKQALPAQIQSLKQTQLLAKQILGITLRTFGAPGNNKNKDTIKALDTIDDIKVWLNGLEGSTKLTLMNGRVGLENPCQYPNFDNFRKTYDECIEEVIAIQIHPKNWGDDKFREFERCMDYLMTHDIEFITPYEYWRLTNG